MRVWEVCAIWACFIAIAALTVACALESVGVK